MQLDMQYRRSVLKAELSHIQQCKEEQEFILERQAATMPQEQASQAKVRVRQEFERRQKNALGSSMEFWKGNPEISPIRGALAVWGLTVDDISVVSFHGTSTKANDTN